jgi:hypothetical protein
LKVILKQPEIMSDYIIIDGDQAIFQPSFGAATVIPVPGQITGSGEATLNGTKVCIEGDESSVKVQGVTYFTPVYSIPGTGTLLIDKLGSDQVAEHTRSGDTALILKGSNFDAKFQVQAPAMQPPPGTAPPVPDATPEYGGGKGSFITTNTKFKGS